MPFLALTCDDIRHSDATCLSLSKPALEVGNIFINPLIFS